MQPIEFVPQSYEMDPETESLITDGSLLEAGMIVLVADPQMRSDLLTIETDEVEMAKALKYNRWGVVDNISIGPTKVRFRRTYDEDPLTVVSVLHTVPWLVRNPV